MQEMPKLLFNAIKATIEEDEYLWHYREKLVSDVHQKPDESIYT